MCRFGRVTFLNIHDPLTSQSPNSHTTASHFLIEKQELTLRFCNKDASDTHHAVLRKRNQCTA